MAEVTPGEIGELRGEIREFRSELREFRNWAERLYVPRGEWVEGRRADQARISDVAGDVRELKAKDTANEKDRKNKERESTNFRRQVLLAVAVAAFSATVSVAITFATAILGKGS